MKIARLLCVLYKDSYLCFRLSTISFRSTNCFVFYFVDIVFCREVKRFYLSYRKITKKKTWLKAFFSINYWRSVAVEGGGGGWWLGYFETNFAFFFQNSNFQSGFCSSVFVCLLRHLPPQWLFLVAMAFLFSCLLITFNFGFLLVRLVRQGPCLV